MLSLWTICGKRLLVSPSTPWRSPSLGSIRLPSTSRTPIFSPTLMPLVSSYSTVKKSPSSLSSRFSVRDLSDPNWSRVKKSHRSKFASSNSSPESTIPNAPFDSLTHRSRQDQEYSQHNERPDPHYNQMREANGTKEKKKKKKHQQTFKSPEPGDAHHPDSIFFKPLSSTLTSASPSSNQHNSNTTSSISSDNPDSPKLPSLDILTYDPSRFANVNTFRELKVASHIFTKLQPRFGITQPTPIQKSAIPYLMHAPFWTERLRGAGARDPTDISKLSEADRIGIERRRIAARAPTPRDLVIQEMTGSGKTLSYVLPMLSLMDNFNRQTQGIIMAPTRELAVQIYRVMRKVNDTSSGRSKRNRHPVTIELAVGRVTDEYAEGIRKYRPHVIIGTPSTLAQLILPPSTEVGKQGGHAAIALQHIRMFVLDEIDHLLLPFSCARVEQMMQRYVGSRSHGAFRRMGRIAIVSAAISERVVERASKWLNRPVTATSDGLLDDWVAPQLRLRDQFKLDREGYQIQDAPTQNQANQSSPTQPTDSPVSEYYEEADEIIEDADDEEDNLSVFAEDRVARAERLANGETIEGEEDEQDEMNVDEDEVDDDDIEDMDENIETEDDYEALAEARDLAALEDPSVVRADEFQLPGVDSAPVDTGVVSLAVPKEVGSSHALADSVEPTESSPLPLAREKPIRFLPPTLKHIIVHVSPHSKLTHHRAHADSLSDHEQRRCIGDKVDLLSRLHAILKPRVALVFFKNSKEAVEIAKELKRTKRMRARLLLANAHLTPSDKVSALRAAAFGSSPFIFATDLASRGLDIAGLSHVINFDPPTAALDYVHRAGRVERLGGRTGCTVVTVIKDDRVPMTRKGEKIDPNRNPSTFIGPQVRQATKLMAQLYLKPRHVVIKSGEFQDFVPPKRTQPIANTEADHQPTTHSNQTTSQDGQPPAPTQTH